MKRSVQEIVELVALALFALLGLTAAAWLLGATLTLAGAASGWLAGVLWQLARFLIPAALVAGAVAWAIVVWRGRQAAVEVAARPVAPAAEAATARVPTESVRRFESDPRVN